MLGSKVKVFIHNIYTNKKLFQFAAVLTHGLTHVSTGGMQEVMDSKNTLKKIVHHV